MVGVAPGRIISRGSSNGMGPSVHQEQVADLDELALPRRSGSGPSVDPKVGLEALILNVLAVFGWVRADPPEFYASFDSDDEEAGKISLLSKMKSLAGKARAKFEPTKPAKNHNLQRSPIQYSPPRKKSSFSRPSSAGLTAPSVGGKKLNSRLSTPPHSSV